MARYTLYIGRRVQNVLMSLTNEVSVRGFSPLYRNFFGHFHLFFNNNEIKLPAAAQIEYFITTKRKKPQ